MNVCGGNGVWLHSHTPSTAWEGDQTPHICTKGCRMQFERFYSLSHSAVTWYWHVYQHLGFQPTHSTLGETFVVWWWCEYVSTYTYTAWEGAQYMMDVGCSLKSSIASAIAQWHGLTRPSPRPRLSALLSQIWEMYVVVMVCGCVHIPIHSIIKSFSNT